MKVAILSVFLLMAIHCIAQVEEPPDAVMEQQIENKMETGESVPDDDDELSARMQRFRRRPLNVNNVESWELEQLGLLTELQIDQFQRYRQQFGRFINIYELQAVPGWDIVTIQKVIPFLSLSQYESPVQTWKAAWKSGHGMLTIGAGRLLEKPVGYSSADSAGESRYIGSRDRLTIRYRFSYGNRLQLGLLAKKDAGEQVFGKSQPAGFDFYGIYCALRGQGLIKSIVIGDFTVNFGQGLTLWQKTVFSGNGVVVGTQRLALPAQAHSSAGEYSFLRGIALGFQRKNWEATVFCSYRRLSANLVRDSMLGQQLVSSVQTSGYHRTSGEMADRNCLSEYSAGSSLKFRMPTGSIAVNAVYWHFSAPFKRSDEAYKLFAFQGRSLYNISLDYSYTWQNIHAFGELAIDPQFNKAFLGGLLISLDPRVDISVFYRNISRAYQSINASAFTSSSTPINEKGFYAGLLVRPVAACEISGYADFSTFPWLKYRVNMPSGGYAYLLQVNYAISRQSKINLRFRNMSSPLNESAVPGAIAAVGQSVKKELQLNAEMSAGRVFVLRQRIALLWFQGASLERGEGFLAYEECFYRPITKAGIALNFRLQYFETDGYDERLFVYEADLPNHFSIPFFYGKGWRYYFNISGKLNWPRRKMRPNLKPTWHLKCAQTIYPGIAFVGEGVDQVMNNHATDISLQLSIPVR